MIRTCHASPNELVDRCRRGFIASFGKSADVTALAPGRINVIGEHTDYNLGLALPGAIDRWTVVGLAAREDDRVTLASEAYAPPARWRQDDAFSDALPSWSRLGFGAARIFAELSGVRRGFDAWIGSNVPIAAGVSSSAALEIAMLSALRGGFEAGLGHRGAVLTDLEMVRAAQRIENEDLGAATGLMDQYVSCFARPRSLLLIDFAAMSHEHVDAELEGWVWVSIDSKVRRELAASAYGARVEESRRGLQRLRATAPEVGSFRDLAEGHLQHIDEAVSRRRLRHYVTENERVRRAAGAVARGDTEQVGALLVASHASLRDDYEVSCDELDCLVDVGAAQEGCAGARMMGGGFGGCTLNLVRQEALAPVVGEISRQFESRFGYAPVAETYNLVGGAHLVEETSS